MEERTAEFSPDTKSRRRCQPLSHTNGTKIRREKDQPAERTENAACSAFQGQNIGPFNAEYLQRLKNNDRTTGEHFNSYFESRLTSKLHGRRLPPWVIQDMIQETFVQVLIAVEKDRVREPSAFGAFVSGVCRNVVLNYWKNSSNGIDVTEIDIPDPAPNLETVVLKRERQEQVERVLKDLPPKDRDLLYAKLDQLSPQEMIERFGECTPENLRLMLHRARKKFAQACERRHLKFFWD
jgi:RNA polymerase sigma factor (sigma-70 family)